MNPALVSIAPQAPAPEEHVHAVENGVIRHLSVSQLQTATLCERRWFLGKVLHIPEPQTKAQEVGVEVHRQIEHYLKSGEDVLGEVAKPMKQYLPAPGGDLLVEWAFNDLHGDEFFPPDQSKLHAAGVPLLGFIDLVNLRGKPRVTDHKTTSNIDAYAARSDQLVHINPVKIQSAWETGTPGAAIQMVGYVEFLRRAGRLAGHRVVEVEHIYGQTKTKRGHHVVAEISPNFAEDQWGAVIEPLAAQMKRLATATSIGDAEPNFNACSKYGRFGCPHQALCAVHLTKTKEKQMGFMEKLKGGAASAAMKIQETGTITGIAVKDCKLGEKYKMPGGAVGEFTGTARDVGFFQTDSGAVKLTLEALVLDANVEPAPAAVVAKAPETMPTAVTAQPPAQVLPPDAPASKPELAAEPPPAPVEEKAKRTRRTKAEMEAARADVEKTYSVSTVPPETVAALTTMQIAAPPLKVYVDAMPNCAAEPLAGYVGRIVGEIERTFGCVDIRCADKKFKNKDGVEVDSPLAFSKWPGVLAAAIKADPPKPGVYVALGTSGNEIMCTAAAALEQMLAGSPGAFTRGVR